MRSLQKRVTRAHTREREKVEVAAATTEEEEEEEDNDEERRAEDKNRG